jgi:hypothetical protein
MRMFITNEQRAVNESLVRAGMTLSHTAQGPGDTINAFYTEEEFENNKVVNRSTYLAMIEPDGKHHWFKLIHEGTRTLKEQQHHDPDCTVEPARSNATGAP